MTVSHKIKASRHGKGLGWLLVALLVMTLAVALPAQNGSSDGRGTPLTTEDERGAGESTGERAITNIGPPPTVEVREVRVRRNRPDEVFHEAGTTVVFWVKDEAGVYESILDNESGIDVFEDSTGRDLITAHWDAVDAWGEKVDRLREQGRFVSMGRSRDLYTTDGLDVDDGGSGFYLTVDSWALPAAETRSFRIEGAFTYVLASETVTRTAFDEINLRDTKIVRVAGYGIRPEDFSRSDDMLSFTLYTNLPLTRFEVRDQEGERAGGIIYTMNGRPVVEMPEALFDRQVELVVEYREPIVRRVEISEEVELGL
jgi:hypothetical protein